MCTRRKPNHRASNCSSRLISRTPRPKAFIGYVKQRAFDLDGVRIAPETTLQNWCAITLTAMDGVSFATPGHILITAAGYVENTGMGWKNAEKSTVGRDWGQAPTLVEGIRATIALPVTANRVRAWSLDERGQRLGEIAVRDSNGTADIEIDGKYGTLWYEVEIE